MASRANDDIQITEVCAFQQPDHEAGSNSATRLVEKNLTVAIVYLYFETK